MTNKKAQPHEAPDWKGYSLDELRYQRAYTAARIEIGYDRLKRQTAALRDAGPMAKSSMLGKVLGTLSYLDIALITFRIGSKVLKMTRRLRS